MSVIGDNIKRRRMEMRLSQTDLADMIGETKQTLWKYESGTVTNIPLPKVEALASALSCDPAWLLGWEDGNVETQSGMLVASEGPAPYLTSREATLLEGFQKLTRENQNVLIEELQTLILKQGEEPFTRGEYTFSSDRPAKFYDSLMRNNPNSIYDDHEFNLWYAAHKFGERVTGPRFSSFRGGVVHGARAREAAEYLDKNHSASFDDVSKMFDVDIKKMSQY